MPTPAPQNGRLRRLSARVGFVGAAFLVFAAGWVAVKATDWRTMALSAVAALIAAWLAAVFRRWSES